MNISTQDKISRKSSELRIKKSELAKGGAHLFDLSHFRLATSADVTRIFALEEVCFNYDKMSKVSIRRLVASDMARVWVCGEGGDVDAYIITLYHSRRNHARIYSLAVHPRCRGLGLGSKLVHFIEKEVLERDLFEIRLEVKPDNGSALQVYLKAGYKVVGKRPSYYSDGSDAITCVKLLEKKPPLSIVY